MELLHDEKAYEDLFGKRFPTKEVALKIKSQEIDEQEFPIEYIAERIPCTRSSKVFGKKQEDRSEQLFDVLDLLAWTDCVEIFKCKFLQRMIDYQWRGKLRHAYIVVTLMYGLSFTLVFANSVLLRFEPHDTTCFARNILNAINIVIIIFTVVPFESR